MSDTKKKHGWKTWTAAIAGMLTALGAVGAGIAADPVNFDMIWGGVTGFIAALGLIGVGDKLQKLTDVLKDK
jgi:hypothetical protein